MRAAVTAALAACVFVGAHLLVSQAGAGELRGHGGPVRALAVSADGRSAVSGGFDHAVIRWSLETSAAQSVLRFHDNSVNAIAILADGRIVSGGEDGRIALWAPDGSGPQKVLEGHGAPISALAVSPDGRSIASASWDETVRFWPLGGGEPVVLSGHKGNVNGVAFGPEGTIVSSGYDATVRVWRIGDASPLIATLDAPLNGIVVAPDGEIIVACADGKVRFLDGMLNLVGEAVASQTPVIALALSRDGAKVAAGGVRGNAVILDRASRSVATELVGPGQPVWSLAFMPDGKYVLSGGGDRVIRRWDTRTGAPSTPAIETEQKDAIAAFADMRGAQVFRACSACHTLRPDEGNRAGPTLHGIFGRRIASVAGYNYSEALKKLDIVWTPETVANLFRLGPSVYTPGTKMPEQTVSPADLKALIEFLDVATRARP